MARNTLTLALGLVCTATLTLPSASASQQPLTLAQALQQLAAQATTLEHSLPSLTCIESVLSQEQKRGKIVRSVDFTASLRAVRASDGTIAESFEYKTVRGRPFLTGGFVMPTYVAGGFSRALRYFAPDQQPCYQYALNGNRIDFVTAPHPPGRCRTLGTTGFAMLDDAGNITHLERRVANRYAREYRQVPYAMLELAPLTLNGTSFPMTTHLIADQPNNGSFDHFEAAYTDCRLFSATVTLGPAVEASETSDQPK